MWPTVHRLRRKSTSIIYRFFIQTCAGAAPTTLVNNKREASGTGINRPVGQAKN